MTALLTGTREYLERLVFSSVDLVAQPVAFSFDRGLTQSTGSWESAGSVRHVFQTDGADVVRYSRMATILLGDTTPLPDPGEYPVWIRVTDTIEIPWIAAGSLVVYAND